MGLFGVIDLAKVSGEGIQVCWGQSLVGELVKSKDKLESSIGLVGVDGKSSDAVMLYSRIVGLASSSFHFFATDLEE